MRIDRVVVADVRYAWSGESAIAYQVFGEGPVDLLYLQGYCSHLDLAWESPYLARFLRGLGARSRVVATDRRGWGLSDRFSPDGVPAMETLAEDLVVVMDDAASERAIVFASYECGILAMLLAATRPDRVAGLVLCDTFPTWIATRDTPSMPTLETWRDIERRIRAQWGRDLETDESIRDSRELEWFTRYERASVAPGALAAETERLAALDVRSVLSSIHVPTLVIGFEHGHRTADAGAGGTRDPAMSRFLAERIPRAKLVQVGDADDPTDIGWWHWYGRGDAILREVTTLIEEIRPGIRAFDRALATVLFTDIVGSTETAADLGDPAWKELLGRHDRMSRAIIAQYRGTDVSSRGDGFFATFDGPARGVRCAQAIVEAVRTLGLEIRAGLHTGEIERSGKDVQGIAVHIGARVGALAGRSQVLVSQTVKDLVAGSGLVFEEAGEHDLKGVPGRWHLYRVVA
jgi:class 3 adenylate cyclase/alpha-beta hydrolase superfamily lysophospholipase